MSTITHGTHDDDRTLTSLDEGSADASTPPGEGAPDLLGVTGTGAAPGGPARRKRMSRSSMLMVVTIGVAGAAIGGMRYLASGPRSSLAAPIKIDYDVEKSRSSAGDHKKVLAELATTQAAQVPPEQVRRNPFMMAGSLQDIEVGGPASLDLELSRSEKAARAEAEKAKKAAEERRRSIEAAFSELDLHSVMGGPTPVARISGQTVRVGDTVGNFFKVRAIQGRTVTLACDDETFTLAMSSGQAPAPSASGRGGSRPSPR